MNNLQTCNNNAIFFKISRNLRVYLTWILNLCSRRSLQIFSSILQPSRTYTICTQNTGWNQNLCSRTNMQIFNNTLHLVEPTPSAPWTLVETRTYTIESTRLIEISIYELWLKVAREESTPLAISTLKASSLSKHLKPST